MSYSQHDQERFLDEPAKRAGRTEFMRDRARVIHSAALRRLAAKTQVAVPWENDFQRTRLSHSLECAQIGRELGESLGADPDLQDTACLAHDLGHPPFGHNGEEALASIAADFGGFEGNAQSFRLLVRLEAKTVDSDGKSVGLNLTRASLDGATKYPWPRSHNSRKFGVYDDDVEVFNWMRTGAPVDKKCIEAQIMDWSDDCAYSVHDLEDAIFANQISVKNFDTDFEELYRVMVRDYGSDATQQEAIDAHKRLSALSAWPHYYDGTHRSLARLKDSTSQLIGRFVLAAELETRKIHGDGPLSRYRADLEIPREQIIEVDFLKAIAGHYLINAAHSQDRYAKQQLIVSELVEMLRARAPQELDSFFLKSWNQASDEIARMRVIIDQVAALTDPGAYALHARLLASR
ncbi:MAG: deoxyguanosinetriphosphate triphosphohydrolase [Actinobacteria bacterium]|nr:deoxyguanosinetriphosphate triphosphohydrolase [Actinomycetota bacterium]NCW43073.1 deoxyguanosinetriphosphate triphosphohydrolase [Actinomycetota bacterium]NCW72012.1 deoxyguanosinetriphosphate triphosphohydrolase [Actinomycetota bacterium]NCW92547.1 deoxyguanosinetriphosphate triphosphohydrolase [Actinomycetota bacterium]NCX15964.1 deoxyguanosinetriphosphate triphosphohydrolase [Actinomycetota bacterium]